jgi:hypothetical protein
MYVCFHNNKRLIILKERTTFERKKTRVASSFYLPNEICVLLKFVARKPPPSDSTDPVKFEQISENVEH